MEILFRGILCNLCSFIMFDLCCFISNFLIILSLGHENATQEEVDELNDRFAEIVRITNNPYVIVRQFGIKKILCFNTIYFYNLND